MKKPIDVSKDDSLNIKLISDRLDWLEEKFELEEKSKFKKLGAWGGIAALVISVFVGGLEIGDKTIGESRRKNEAKLEKVSNSIEKLSRYSQEIVSLMANGKGNELNLRVPQITSERSRILAEIDVVLGDVWVKLDTTTLINLSSEYGAVLRYKDSLVYAERAVEKAETLLLQIESRRYLGKILNTPSLVYDKNRARNTFQDALSLAADDTLPKQQLLSLRYGIYGEWIRSESANGDCKYIKKLTDEYLKFISENPIPGQRLNIKSLKTSFEASSKCKLY